GLLGAALTGLMVLLFLRDLRSAFIVILNIPIAIAAALLALWINGYTVNLMTLGGLALAVGILVDEATVEIENIHRRMKQSVRALLPALSWTPPKKPSARARFRCSASLPSSCRASS
ncbi:MAG: hypothetical protein RIS79_1510, partial [Verrucomicrobiota bacterium]